MALNRICCKECKGNSLQQKYDVWYKIDEFGYSNYEQGDYETDEYYCSDCKKKVDIEYIQYWVIGFYNEDFKTGEISDSYSVLVEHDSEPDNNFIVTNFKKYTDYYKYWVISEYEDNYYDEVWSK